MKHNLTEKKTIKPFIQNNKYYKDLKIIQKKQLSISHLIDSLCFQTLPALKPNIVEVERPNGGVNFTSWYRT